MVLLTTMSPNFETVMVIIIHMFKNIKIYQC